MKFLFPILIIITSILSSCSQIGQAEEHKYRKTNLVVKEKIPLDFFPRDIDVVAAGDSLTKGVGDSTEKGGYVPYLQSLLEDQKGIKGVQVHNYGVSGHRSDQVLSRLRSSEVSNAVSNADLVILTVGGNDVMKVIKDNFTDLQISKFKKQKDKYEKNLTQIMNEIRAENENSVIVLIGLYNPFTKWFSDVQEMNEIIEDWNSTSQSVLSNYRNAYFVEVDELFSSSSKELLFKDYFHPNNEGYALIADNVYDTLHEVILTEKGAQAFSAIKKGANSDEE
ncbi:MULTISPECIES: SGNH/GDSL hydrolase family protein [unclassified Bacillus (in: firmicutes)]|uniref:SGNH/GDSL hydrolase family protein n=1 Tax=unclassified Bacillus (in: firmicutes) TaxID=185979 RepID=UPI0008E48770|nr:MULTISPECIES: SGNH/GDSL hydrolase family protein [unclassified Bacillus (in: firmicutes)]SFA92231.1 Lysophospholipase L1 [Bacillus sp. UNCCL13]SFQ85847.1 Lysophospholipase L1 [Bacillus sp. cl95]